MWKLVVGLLAIVLLVAIGVGVYGLVVREPIVLVEAPQAVVDNHQSLPPDEEFARLARTDPVAMFDECLIRYQREVKGFKCGLEKEERIKGELKPLEKIALYVRGEVPDPATNKTHIEVLMKWKEGAQKVMLFKVEGVLYREDQSRDKMTTWRPDAVLSKANEVSIVGKDAQGASRYCIQDAGLYRTMLRTYNAWKTHQDAKTFNFAYEGLRAIPQLGGVECHVVKRICRTPELDPFAMDFKVSSSDTLEQEGFSEVTVFVDAKRWLQVGTELRRANGELIGAYYFKDVELNPTFSPETFEKDGLLKKKLDRE